MRNSSASILKDGSEDEKVVNILLLKDTEQQDNNPHLSKPGFIWCNILLIPCNDLCTL